MCILTLSSLNTHSNNNPEFLRGNRSHPRAQNQPGCQNSRVYLLQSLHAFEHYSASHTTVQTNSTNNNNNRMSTPRYKQSALE